MEDRLVLDAFTVNTLADTEDDDPKVTSLREAIIAANMAAENQSHTIDFTVQGTINLTSELDALDRNITIDGPGLTSNNLTVQRSTAAGTPDFRIFRVNVNRDVTIKDMTIANGTALDGGGILNSGVLSLERCLVRNNTTTSPIGFGGGVNSTGSLTVLDCTLQDNTARNGAGIASDGALVVRRSTIFNNQATNNGGGMWTGGSASLQGTTITFNSAKKRGGGVYLAGGSFGRGENVNVTDNTAKDIEGPPQKGPSGSGGSLGEGGGVYAEDGSSFEWVNTIIAENDADLYRDIRGSLNSLGTNLIGDGTGGEGFDPTDLVGTFEKPIDPLLGPLQDNGGPTLTRRPLPGSPVIDAGNDAYVTETTDQRGFTRIVGLAVDIGAVEVQEGEL